MVTEVADTSDLILRVDGSRPLLADSLAELGAVCDAAEDAGAYAFVIVRVSGVPGPNWANDLPVALVSKWERGLRRLERVPAVTIAVAEEDCGGPALDALLAADYRIMPAGAKLIVPVVAGATWPGMALYRLARQAAGTASARRAVLFGTPIEAAAARAIGVIDEVAGNTTIAIEKAMEVAAVARGTELAIRRQLMQEALTTSYEDALGVHLAACDRALRRLAAGAP
jgi:isomerase DpgB